MNYVRGTAWERFWPKVNASGDCWEWTGAKTGKGYGSFCSKTTKPVRTIAAHRWSWEALVGPIPYGYEIDHLCKNRVCVNPDHLEPVSHAVNVGRGSTGKYQRPDVCLNGHPLDGDNAYIRPDGKGRSCRECQRKRNREYEQRYVDREGVWR